MASESSGFEAISELTPDGIVDFGGDDDDRYLASQGIETEGMRAIA